MPRTFIFDAVHTVLRPVPDVRSAYFDAGLRHGSDLSREQVGDRFRVARRQRFSTYVAASQTQPGALPSSDEIEFELWRGLVSDIFLGLESVGPLFDELWNHFASPDNWQLYDDVSSCFLRLKERGDRIVIASNFDSRLHDIVAKHDSLGIADSVFCSAEIGYRKPDPLFYKTVAESLGLCESDDVTMIGDDFENDYVAPVRFGWKAFHLDRRSKTNHRQDTINSLSSI